jgi:hypothetical protein
MSLLTIIILSLATTAAGAVRGSADRRKKLNSKRLMIDKNNQQY